MQVLSYSVRASVMGSFTQHVFKVSPRCSLYQNFLPFKGGIIFSCAARARVIYPSVRGHLVVAALRVSLLNLGWQSFHCGSVVTNLISIHENVGSIPGLTQWVKDLALL